MNDDWVTLPYFALRMSGFPFELLERLSSVATADAARRLVLLRDEIERTVAASHSSEVLSIARSRADGAVLRAIRKRKCPAPQIMSEVAQTGIRTMGDRFTALLDDEVRAEQEFLELYPTEELRTSDRLVGLFQTNADLRDALLVSNESSEPVLSRWVEKTRQPEWRWHKDDRSRVDTLVRHLQRACAKNDTTSHLGPYALGTFASDSLGVTAEPVRLTRLPLLSRWAGEAIATAMRDDPRVVAQCRPRRAPGALLSHGVLQVLAIDSTARVRDIRDATQVRPPVELGPYDQAVLALCDGARTVARISELAPLAAPGEHPSGDVRESLLRLERLGAIVVGPELPYGSADPLAELAAYEGDQEANAWRGLLLEAQHRLAEFGAADSTTADRRSALDSLKQSFEAYTGVPAERGSGRFYGDRSVLHEDCSGRYADLSIGKPLTDHIEEVLPLAYELTMAVPQQRYAAESRLLNSWYAKRFPGRMEVGIHEYLTAFIEDSDGLVADYAEIDAHEAALLDRIETALIPSGSYDASAVSVEATTVRRLVAAIGDGSPVLCNPDLMIAAASHAHLASGDFSLVISELHANEESLSHGLFGPVLDERYPGFTSAVTGAYRRLLAEDEDLASVTLAHRNKSYIRTALDTVEIEAIGRSPLPRERVLVLADLRVMAAEGTLRLRNPETGRFQRMAALPYAWLGVRQNPFVPFGFARHQGGRLLPGSRHPHLPRITLDSVVLQREHWRVPAEELSARHRRDAFLKVQQVREERCLTRHMYAKVPGETKPLYCDLESPLLVRQLTRMAALSSEPIDLSEMLPGPEHLWVADPRGHYTSELRYAAFSSPRH